MRVTVRGLIRSYGFGKGPVVEIPSDAFEEGYIFRTLGWQKSPVPENDCEQFIAAVVNRVRNVISYMEAEGYIEKHAKDSFYCFSDNELEALN